MMIFCFNDCLADVDFHGELIKVFSKFIEDYNAYSGGNFTKYRLVMPDCASNLYVSGRNIKELIDSIPRESVPLKRLAYSVFSKNYPLSQFLKDMVLDDDWNKTYTFLNKDAYNLFIAYKQGWFIMSIPVCNEVKKNEISLCVNDGSCLSVRNWYGENSDYFKVLEVEDARSCEQRLVQIENMFSGKTVYMPNKFREEFSQSSSALQNLIIAKLGDAYNASLLFPSRADDNLVKCCVGIGNESTYELRAHAHGGMRVYFYSDENKLVIGALHTKSSSIGDAQSYDINRATARISKILKSI